MRKSSSGRNSRLFPNSLRIISSCLKTVSSNAISVASTVRSAGASVASSISVASENQKDQVLWAGFDKLELGPSAYKHVLLLGYSNGFQVFDVEDASDVRELVSKRDGPVTFLQMQPCPLKSEDDEGFRTSHPLLLVVTGDETNSLGPVQIGNHVGVLVRDGNIEPQSGNCSTSPTAVQFYSLRSHSYVHVLRFRSAVYMVRCSPQIVAVGLAAQIYCFDALTLENKFSVLTYPVPQVVGQGMVGVNIGYGPMAVGTRWLAYASNNPLLSNSGRLSAQSLTPSPGVSPSTSPGSGSLVARYAMESSKQLAAGIINLSDIGYKKMSKYYQELLPDGSSSPVSSNSSWKVGRLAAHSTETDNAGMVVVKDFVSRAVISQFKAHTSPISALCFDPSGTLLVTASVYGNNINIFRIMPSCTQNGSGIHTYDWSSSHVHLYKLHRGITAAVIQDICFSHYSQWIAIVSSRGTCHIFIMSPFGGDTSLQTQKSHGDGPTILSVPSLPWWSTSSCTTNPQCFLPPPPITLSVVSRIKDGNSGWLNTVGNVAASVTGKVTMPSGAIAAVFHSSINCNLQPGRPKVNALEHLLVYSPSGHVIEHKLLPLVGVEPSDSGSRTGPDYLVQIQDEESRVKVEPVQWWDVCRRLNWPEREECISRITPVSQEDNDAKYLMESKNSIGEKHLVKPHEGSHLYLSNAEVQISFGRIPIWQNSKICFYMMGPLMAKESNFIKDYTGGEIEIEKVPVHEVEIMRKDLFPVCDRLHSIQSYWNNRGLVGGRYPSDTYSEPHGPKEKVTEETVICHSKLASLGSMDSSDGGSSKAAAESLLDVNKMYPVRSGAPIGQTMNSIDEKRRVGTMVISPLLNQCSSNKDNISFLAEHSKNCGFHVEDSCVANGLPSSKSNSLSVGRTIAEGTLSSNTSGTSEVSNASSDLSASSMNILEEGPIPADLHDPLDFGQFFQEGYCKASEFDKCHELAEDVTDVDSSSGHCEMEKREQDGENDGMLGGIFAFSEEG